MRRRARLQLRQAAVVLACVVHGPQSRARIGKDLPVRPNVRRTQARPPPNYDVCEGCSTQTVLAAMRDQPSVHDVQYNGCVALTLRARFSEAFAAEVGAEGARLAQAAIERFPGTARGLGVWCGHVVSAVARG